MTHDQPVFLVSPPMRSHLSPRFYELEEDRFEELCSEILQNDPSIRQSSVYGTRGQAQRGIDLWAQQREGDGVHVGQCKCYKDITVANLSKWSGDFLNHWETHWSERSVTRFILYVACDVTRTELIEARDQQIARFAAVEVQYELIDARQLTRALSPYPQIVQRYLGYGWVEILCGSTAPLPLGRESSSIVSTTSPSNFEEIVVRLSDYARARVDTALEIWRQGHRNNAETQLLALRNDSIQWESLGNELRGKVLRILARLAIENTQLPLARQLQGQAQAIEPTPDDGLEGLLIYRETGAEAALTWLNTRPNSEHKLRVALHLELGQLEDALKILEEHSDVRDADYYRLRALHYLASGNVEAASTAIQEALLQTPNWVSIRLVAAIVNYYRALSPAAYPSLLVAWPEPVHWDLVRRDTESLTLLTQTTEDFASLVALSESPNDRRTFLLWQAASTINHIDRQAEALTQYQRLLEEDSSDYRAWIWAIARNLPIDHRPSVRAIGLRIGNGTATIPQVLTLLNYHLNINALGKARHILRETRILFQQAREQELWSTWTEALKAVDRATVPLPSSNGAEATPLQRQATLEVLSQRAHRSGDYSSVITYLQDCYDATNDGRYLLALCNLLMRTHQWAQMSTYARSLLERVGTAEAVYMAVVGSFNAHDHHSAITLLNEGRAAFRNNEFPPELERLYIKSLHHTGRSRDALRLAQSLVERDPSTSNMLTLLDLRAERGDIAGVSTLARQVQASGVLTAEQALHLTNLLRFNRQQAEELLGTAIEAGIPDDLVGQAIGLANAIGLQSDNPIIIDLMRRLMELGHRAEGGVRVVTLEEIRTLLQEIHAQHVEMRQLYRSGQLPLHLLEHYVPSILMWYYHGLLDANISVEGKGQTALLMRSGNRRGPLQPPTMDPPPRLHMDVSSLLLAHHFGLLDQLQRVFARFYIPPELPRTLLDLWNNLQHHQPQQLEEQRLVVEAVERHQITPLLIENDDWFNHLQAAAGEPGSLLVFHNQLPTEHGIGVGDVLEILVRAGALTVMRAEQARIALGIEADAKAEVVLPRKSALLCQSGLVELLVSAGILTAASRYFRLFLSTTYLERLKASLHTERLSQQDARWLNELRERVLQGLEENVFELTSVIPGALLNEVDQPRTNAEVGLMTLMAIPVIPEDVIWIDDRFVSRYAHRNEALLVGIFDIIAWLYEWNVLTEASYYDLLYRMRAANLRHLPLLPNEILFHLLKAPVEENEVIETPELRVLRRYYAEGLTQPGQLQPPVPPENLGELEWILTSRKAVSSALAGLWAQEDNHRETRANWILDHLYYETVDVTTLFNLPEPRDPTQVAALWLLDLSLIAVDRTELPNDQRHVFLEWLDTNLLKARFHQSPSLGEAVTNLAKDLLNQIAIAPEVANQRALLVEYVLSRVPQSLQEMIVTDHEWLRTMEVRVVEQLKVGEAAFAPTEFWRALEQACSGQTVEITEQQSARTVIVSPVEPGRGGWQFAQAADNPKIVHESYQVLVAPNSEAREQYLREHRHWFDVPTPEFENILAEVRLMNDPSQRVERAQAVWDQSVTYFYHNLDLRLAEHLPIEEHNLIPPMKSILRALGLEQVSGLEQFTLETFEEATSLLLEQEGLEVAIQRLWGIPVGLSRPIRSAVLELSEPARREMLERLIDQAGIPLTQLHLLSLLQLEANAVWQNEYARELWERITSQQGYKSLQELTQFATWSLAQIDKLEEEWALPARLAVAWTHAQHLYALMARNEWGTSHVASWLIGRLPLGQHTFRLVSEMVWDMTYPILVEPAGLFLGGLSNVLGQENVIPEWLRTSVMDAVWKDHLWQWRLHDLTDLPNCLNAWITTDLGQVWTELIPQDSLENGQFSDTTTTVEQILELLPETPDDWELWWKLWLRRAPYSAPHQWSDTLLRAILALNFSDVSNVGQNALLLEFITRLARRNPDPQIRTHLQEQWEKLVENIGGQELSDLEVGSLFISIVSICTFAESHQEMHSLVANALARTINVPAVVPYLRILIPHLQLALPPSESQFYEVILARLNLL